MPLGFRSLNHGVIAFGFFNIDTDLLLLEHYFLFLDVFCRYISRATRVEGIGPKRDSWDVHTIENREDIGDLMGAIHGIRYTGFIGAVYRRFPFPERQENFKQQPDGWKNRSEVKRILNKYARRVEIPFEVDPEEGKVTIGEFFFDEMSFREIVRYVWMGGYPGWKDGIRPDIVSEMKHEIEKSPNRLFSGLQFLERKKIQAL